MLFLRGRALLAAMATMVALAAPCASQTLRVSLEELAAISDGVVLGRTTSAESYWAPDSSAILTRVVITSEDPQTGRSTGQRVVTVPGGRIGKYVHEVSDTPVFRTGEDVLVFLETHESGLLLVAGGSQGKMDIIRDPTSGAATVRGAAHLFTERAGLQRADALDILEENEPKAAVPLGDFLRRIEKLDVKRR